MNKHRQHGILWTMRNTKRISCGTLARPTGFDQCDICARFNLKGKITQDTNTRASWVTEINALEMDMTSDRFPVGDISFCRLRVDPRHQIKKLDADWTSTFCRGDTGHEREKIPALIASKVVLWKLTMLEHKSWCDQEIHTIRPTKNWKVLAYHLDTRTAPHRKMSAMTRK